MQAVWMVRSRQILSRFRFWLVIFGYDPRDHSLTHKLYLVYAAAFYTVWAFAVLSLLAGVTAQLLESAGQFSAAPGASTASLPALAVGASTLGLLVWTLLATYRASRRSPLIFTEDDAYLICQTPADRRAVALAWLAGQWPESAAPLWAIAVTLGFALVEGSSQGNLSGADIPRYVLAGLRSLSIVLPVQLGLMAISWALGAFRLQRDHIHPRLYLLPLAASGLLALGCVSTGSAAFLPAQAAGSAPPWSLILWPLQYPLQAGFGLSNWPSGMLLSLGWAAAGLLALSWAAAGLNLSRASQESRGIAARESAFRSGAFDQLEELEKRDTLGIEHPPSPWFTRIDWKSRNRVRTLVMKDIVQTSRLRFMTRLWRWFILYLVGLGVLLIPALPGSDWAVAALALLYWSILLAQQSTRRLHDDLSQWFIFRQLPIGAGRLILGELAFPWAGAVLASWANLATVGGLQLAGLPGFFEGRWTSLLGLALLAPVLIASVASTSALDVLRQAKSAQLLANQAPQPGALSLFLGGGLVLLAALLVSQLQGLGIFLALVLGAGIVWLLFRLAARQLQRIR